MAQLPGSSSSYMSDSARTEDQMKTAFENLYDVIAEIGSSAPVTRTISAGAVSTAPSASFVQINAEGSGADDELNTISTTGIDEGRIIVIQNNNTSSSEATDSEKITINHGVGTNNIELTEGSGTFVLCAKRKLGLVYRTNRWVEIWRDYGRKNAEDATAERTSLGLGDVAVESVASSSGASANGKVLKVAAGANLATDALLAIDSSGNITTGTVTGGNADTVDSKHASDFVSSTGTSAQAMVANLTSTTSGATRFNANSTGTAAPGLGIQHNGADRGLVYVDTSNGELYLQSKDSGGTATPQIRLNPANDRLEFNTGTASWQSLRPGPGNGLDADKLDGLHAAQIYAQVLSLVSGASGSIQLYDGTTTLLIQWPQESDWDDEGSGATSTERWTFPTAYASAPAIIGLSSFRHGVLSNSVSGQPFVATQLPTVSATYVEVDRTYTTGFGNTTTLYAFSRSGTPIAIGVPA